MRHFTAPSGGAAIAMMLLVGALDGAWRAHLGQPTLLGEAHESLSTLHVQARTAINRGMKWKPAKLHQDSLLQSSNVIAYNQSKNSQACNHQWECAETMLCLDHACAACSSDASCRLRNPQDECYSDELAGHNVCRHRTLLPHMDSSDLWMAGLTFVIMFFAAPVSISFQPPSPLLFQPGGS